MFDLFSEFADAEMFIGIFAMILEGSEIAEDDVEDDSDGVLIGGWAGVMHAEEEFGGDEAAGAHDIFGTSEIVLRVDLKVVQGRGVCEGLEVGGAAWFEDSCESEVGNFGDFFGIEKDIIGFDIAMEDAGFMHCVETAADFGDFADSEFEVFVRAAGAWVSIEPLVEVAAGEEFGDHELAVIPDGAGDIAGIEDLEDVSVTILCGGGDFASEAFRGVRVCEFLGVEDFDGDSGIEAGGVCVVDGAEAAAADPALDGVAFDAGPPRGFAGIEVFGQRGSAVFAVGGTGRLEAWDGIE